MIQQMFGSKTTASPFCLRDLKTFPSDKHLSPNAFLFFIYAIIYARQERIHLNSKLANCVHRNKIEY